MQPSKTSERQYISLGKPLDADATYYVDSLGIYTKQVTEEFSKLLNPEMKPDIGSIGATGTSQSAKSGTEAGGGGNSNPNHIVSEVPIAGSGNPGRAAAEASNSSKSPFNKKNKPKQRRK